MNPAPGTAQLTSIMPSATASSAPLNAIPGFHFDSGPLTSITNSSTNNTTPTGRYDPIRYVLFTAQSLNGARAAMITTPSSPSPTLRRFTGPRELIDQ